MEYFREELFPCVSLTAGQTDKFKTGCMTAYLLTQLHRETAAENAVLPYVLRRGTKSLPDMRRISERLDALYGAEIEPSVRKLGEIQAVGFYAGFAEDAFLPGETDVLGEVISLLSELWLSPATRGGLLLAKYVDSEKEHLADLIRSRVNNKHSYAIARCLEEMCCYEDFSVSRFGDAESAMSIRYQKLTRQYRELLQSSPVEIFYCGMESEKKVRAALRDALSALPRANINYDLGTDVRMNAVEAAPRFVEEEMDVTQGKLVMGFRLGECMEEPDVPAIRVFNAVFGGGTTSKLFVNVRERLQLCYYASSMADVHKGVLLVSSGIEFDKLDVVRGEILNQLEAIRRGEVGEEELASAKACVASDLRALTDSQGELEGFYLSQILDGLDCGPMEIAELVEEVSLEDVVAVAKSVECDMIYFLRGEDVEDNDAEEDI